jgi:uncharacterized protein involved in type VI secretion and phage assembly
MGGKNRGSWFIPDVNDEVLICLKGNPRRPVVGALWNGSDTPPESMDGAGTTITRCCAPQRREARMTPMVKNSASSKRLVGRNLP